MISIIDKTIAKIKKTHLSMAIKDILYKFKRRKNYNIFNFYGQNQNHHQIYYIYIYTKLNKCIIKF